MVLTKVKVPTILLLRNEFDFLKVHGIMNTLGLFQSEARRAPR